MESTDPGKFPTIEIDGKPVEIRFRLGDCVRLIKSGATKPVDTSNPTLARAENIEQIFAMLANGIRHAGIHKTAEELMDQFDFADFPAIAAAVNEAMGKVTAQANQAAKMASPTTATPN